MKIVNVKINKICLIILIICVPLFLLNGCATCATIEAQPDITNDDGKDDGDKSENAPLSEPVKSESPEPPKLSPTPKLSPAIEEMIAEAPEGCVLAIVRMPDAPRFSTLGKPRLTMDASQHYPGLICETVLLVPLVGGISIDIERFELNDDVIPQQISSEVLYHINGNIGEFYALNTYLAESLPTMSVTASIGGKESVWTCVMDGRGDQEIEYL